MKKIFFTSTKITITWLGLTVVFLLLIELIIRFISPPTHFFQFEEAGEHHLYKANMRMDVSWGKLPYVIETNSFGMRSPEPDPRKGNILALGASVTDGMYVDGFKNWPSQLHKKLEEKNMPLNVLNLAKGGGSFHEYYSRLKYFLSILKAEGIIIQISPNWFFHNPRYDTYAFDGTLVGNSKAKTLVNRAGEFFIDTASGEFLIRWFNNIPKHIYFEGERSLNSNRTTFADGNRFKEFAERDRNDINLKDELNLVYGLDFDGGNRLNNGNTYSEQINDGFRFLDKLIEMAISQNMWVLIDYEPTYHELYFDRRVDSSHSFLFTQVKKHINEVWPKINLVSSFDVIPIDSEQVFHLAPYDLHPNSIYYSRLADLMTSIIENWETEK